MSDLVSILKTISQRRLIDESKKLTKLNELENVIKFFKSSPWKQIVKNDTSEKKTFAHSIAISYLKSVLGEDKFAFVDTELDFSGKKKLVVLHDKGGIIEKLSQSARSKLEKYEFSNFKNRNKGYISAKPKTVEDPEDTSNNSQGLENEVIGASQHEHDHDDEEQDEPERPEPKVLGASRPPDDDDPVYHDRHEDDEHEDQVEYQEMKEQMMKDQADEEHEVTGASQSESADDKQQDAVQQQQVDNEHEEQEEEQQEEEQQEEEQQEEEQQEEGTLGVPMAYMSVGASGFVYRFPGVNTVKTNFSDEVNNKISFSSSYDTSYYNVGDTVTFDAYRFTSTSLTDTTGETLNFSLYYGESTNKTETYVLVIPPITTPITLTYNFNIEGGEDYSGDNFGHGDQNFITVNGTEVTLSLDNFTSSGGNLLLNTKRN